MIVINTEANLDITDQICENGMGPGGASLLIAELAIYQCDLPATKGSP